MSKLETNTIDNISGSSTLNLGDTNATNITIDNGVTTLDFGTGISTVSNMPAVFKNTPAFLVLMDADQTLTTSTFTKLELDTETYDTDNAFDTSSYKFTVPTGKAGKYLFTYSMGTNTLNNTAVSAVRLSKNGTAVNESFARSYPNQNTGGYPHKTCVLNLAAADYIELYGQHTKGSNADAQSEYTFLSGHRLIGV